MSANDSARLPNKAQADQIVSALQTIAGNSNKIAPAFSSAVVYTAGDYVTYNDAIYRCNTTTTANAAFNSSQWDVVLYITEEIRTFNTAYCNTAASTAAKTATMPSFSLVTGTTFRLYIKNTNSASSPTLSVNSTTAKSIKVNGSAASTSNLTAGWWDVLYDGSYYQLKNTGSMASEERTALGLGTAATKSSTTSITSSGSGLPTSATVYSYTNPVKITADDTTPPSDTRSLWVYPSA